MPRVLLIEADHIVARNLKQQLERVRHEVDWQVELQAAVNSADRQSPDLVITDLLLAGRSGVEFLYELRSYPEWQHVPVIIYSQVSANELGEAESQFGDLGVSAFHHKPTSRTSELLESVELLLATRA